MARESDDVELEIASGRIPVSVQDAPGKRKVQGEL